ncbi:amidohydrolase family protein [Demetria terragena]|uniref:amidohydrolase family protein n=1 Tax=Demetria terragena TaxID=63959 RepID=UPI0003633551|nr:amidohydrolase family protein [Demetria terragena]
MRLDAHLHVWERSLGVYHWIGPHLGSLDDDFTPVQAQRLLEAADMTGAVLVQAADAIADTRYLLDAAAANPWVAGVIGWVDLERPDVLEESLAAYDARDVLCGVRQLVHDDVRPDMLSLPMVRRTAQLLVEHDLALDVPDAFPNQIRGAIEMAQASPDLTLVLDHLGKPPRGRGGMESWAAQVRELASHPQVVAKVSGLQCAEAPFGAVPLRQVWELALEVFGPSRLMFGSDWPMIVDGPGYAEVTDVSAQLIGELSAAEQDWVWWRTAKETYRLPLTREELS